MFTAISFKFIYGDFTRMIFYFMFVGSYSSLSQRLEFFQSLLFFVDFQIT